MRTIAIIALRMTALLNCSGYTSRLVQSNGRELARRSLLWYDEPPPTTIDYKSREKCRKHSRREHLSCGTTAHKNNTRAPQHVGSLRSKKLHALMTAGPVNSNSRRRMQISEVRIDRGRRPVGSKDRPASPSRRGYDPRFIWQDACGGRVVLEHDTADWGSKSYCHPCREFRRDTSENCACCNVRKNHCPPQTVRTKRLHIHNRLHCSAQLPLRVRGTPEKLFFACSIPRVIGDWNSTRTLRRAAVPTITLGVFDSATRFWRPPEMKRW